MRKSSTSQKKGIQKGISKHKFWHANQSRPWKSQGLFGLEKQKIFHLGQRSFDLIFLVATKLRLVGFTRNKYHDYVPLHGKNKLLHGFVIGILLVLCCQKIFGTLYMLMHEDLKMESFMCITLSMIYLDAVMIGVGVIAKPKETMDILNSWPKILSCLNDVDENLKNWSGFHDISTSLKVIAVLLVAQWIAFAAAVMTLIMSDLPVCLFPIARRLGWITVDETTMTPFLWQLLLFPLEYLSYMPATFISAYGTVVLFVSFGVMKIYLRELGKLLVTDMKRRGKVEKMYLQLTLFNRVVHVWLRLVLPPVVFATSSTVIIALFVTIRFTQLPLLLYILFPYVGISIIFMMFWQFYDTIRIMRAAENILEPLWSHEAPYLKRLSKVERTKVLKKAKAMKPLIFPIGDSEFSINVPIMTWEEILNQLLFLLSL